MNKNNFVLFLNHTEPLVCILVERGLEATLLLDCIVTGTTESMEQSLCRHHEILVFHGRGPGKIAVGPPSDEPGHQFKSAPNSGDDV